MSVLVRISLVLAFLLSSCLQLDDDVVTKLKENNDEEEEELEPEWFYIRKTDGLAEDTVTTMLRDSRGDYWFGYFKKGITKWDGYKGFIRIFAENVIKKIIQS
ncbi:MAG: hypothetical protein O9340_01970 [Cyclobacteriaceae bacterium]|nr:hypothetical protein [Cyclobacteriaceae bacterium]